MSVENTNDVSVEISLTEKSLMVESGSTFESIQQQVAKGDIPGAIANLDSLDPEKRNSVEGFYLTAVCHRYLRNSALCVEALEQLQKLAPEYGRGYQERGHLLKEMGREEEALQFYRQACAFNPALIASWRGQLEIYKARGVSTGNGHIATQVARLSKLPKPLLAGSDMLHEGKLLKAERICRSFMQKNPKNIEGMRILAEIGVRFGVLDEAQFLLESDYRKIFENGSLYISGAAKPNSENNLFDGYFQIFGNTIVFNKSKLSFDATAVSDSSFLGKYGYSDTDRLTNTIALTKQLQHSFSKLTTTYFTSLRENEKDEYIIVPNFYTRYYKNNKRN